MLYITDEHEKLSDLMTKEDFDGSLSTYVQKFNHLNAHFAKAFSASDYLPSYYPVFLVTEQSEVSYEQSHNARELSYLSLNERQKLRAWQENNIDFIEILAGQEILENIKPYMVELTHWLEDPIIKTPWPFWNGLLANKDILPSLISDGAETIATRISKSPRFLLLDELSRNMLERYELQLQYEKLRLQKAHKTHVTMQRLQRGIDERTFKIKQLLKPTVENNLAKHVNSAYNQNEIRKLASKSTGAKMARKGKIMSTRLDFVSRTSLPRLTQLISTFKGLSKYTGKMPACLDVITFAGNCTEACYNDGFNGLLRQSVSQGTGIVVGSVVGAAVTSYLIGAAGTAFLVATPLGWAIIIFTGIAAGAICASATKDCVEQVYDRAGEGLNNISASKFKNIGEFVYYLFEQYGRRIAELD